MARRTSVAGACVAFAKQRSTVWSSALTGRAAADDGMHGCTTQPINLSKETQATSGALWGY